MSTRAPTGASSGQNSRRDLIELPNPASKHPRRSLGKLARLVLGKDAPRPAGCSDELCDVFPGLAAGPSTARLLSALAERDVQLQDQVRVCYDEISRCIGAELTLSHIISRRPEIFEGLLGEVLHEQTAEKNNLLTAMDILMGFASEPIAPKAACSSGPAIQVAAAGEAQAFPVG